MEEQRAWRSLPTLCPDTIVARRKRVHLLYDTEGELLMSEVDMPRLLAWMWDRGYKVVRVPIPNEGVMTLRLDHLEPEEPDLWQK